MVSDVQPYGEGTNDEVAGLIRRLHETEQRLRELTGGEVDAVMHPAGTPYLLYQAQKRLLDSEAAQRQLASRQSDILNALPAHIALLDQEGRIIAINDAWRDFAGANFLEQVDYGVGQNYVQVCENASGACSKEAQKAAAGIRVVLAGAKSDFSLDYPCHSVTERRWFRLLVAPLREGHATGVVVAHIDITERKEAEDELRIRALQQAAIAELGQAALKGIGWSELMDRVVSMLTRTFEVEFSSVLQVLPDKSAHKVVAAFGLPSSSAENEVFAAPGKTVASYTLLSGNPIILDGPTTDMRFADSKLFELYGIVSGISVAIPGDNGPWGALGAYSNRRRTFTQDDTVFIQSVANLIAEANRRQRHEEVLRESKAFLEIAGESAHLGGWIVELPEYRVRWSDEVCAIYEMPPGTSPSLDEAIEFYAPESRERVRRVFDACTVDGTPFDEQLELITATGRHISVRAIGRILRDRAGAFIRVQGALQDITKQLAVEERLKQSQRLESIGQLTGGVAHDFNNLLTIIRGNSELLIEQLTDDEQLRTMAEMTLDAARRGAELTYRLLAFARRQALEPKVIDASNLLVGMVPLLRRTLSEDIEIELVPNAALWHALVDPSQLEGAVLNLCINARDAMQRGGRIIIETKNVVLDEAYAGSQADVTPGEYVMVAVSDTGTGITPENLARVFDPFFTTKDIGKGTGLGLSMVYGFIKQSRGHIKLYSEMGTGTVAKMFIPRSKQVREAVAEAPVLIADLVGTEKILLVEDDDLVRRHAESQLILFGYRVITAANGPAALEIIRETEDVDLLLTDVVMPGGMNGRALVDHALRLRPELRVLYASGYTDNAIIHQGRLNEGTYLLSKPYSRIELAQKVRAALAVKPDPSVN
jgi:signal transduction histidine kinase/GAF domain-containing protein/ActR/RegA family two-component response regulator